MDQNYTSESPLVTVIIPAYNAQVYIAQALHSALRQTYKNIEVLVVDDGSQDHTPEIVQSIARDDCRVTLLKQSNQGVAAARNLAIGKSKGEYVAPLDADDVWFPHTLEKLLDCLRRGGPSAGVSYAWSVYIDADGRMTGGYHASNIEGNVYATLLTHNFLGNSSASLIRRVCFEKVGVYDRKFREHNAQGCEDWDLYLRIAEHHQFRVVSEFLIGYRKTLDSMTSDYAAMTRSHGLLLDSVRRQHPEIPGSAYRLSLSSFYLYLAHESERVGEHRLVLHWLSRAVHVDPVTPFLRYGLYVLLIQSVVLIVAKLVGTWFWPDRPAWATSPAHPREITLYDVKKRRISLKCRLLVQDVLHYVMRRIVKL